MAVDRAAIAKAFSEIPATRLFSPAFQVRDAEVPELSGPNLEGATALLAGRTGKIRFGVVTSKFCGGACSDLANAVKASLAPLGITVVVVEEDDPFAAAADPKSKIDIVDGYSQPLYPDPVKLLQQIVEGAPSGWLAPEVVARVTGLAPLTGEARLTGAATAAHDLVGDAWIIPFGFSPDGAYLAADVGCQTIVPGIMNLDLAALCAK